ncbi:MAG: T9SS type A sorting domain-containing protein [Bacteroidetes bacterium]|nr:T9SS type A sorting domain-containing protein [Bacteroidota bacterium]
MKRLICLFFFCFVWLSCIYSQKITGPFIMKPIYFNISPPLISLTKPLSVKPESRKAERAEKEIWNWFRKNQKRNRSRKNSNDQLRQEYFGKIQPDSVLGNFDGTPNMNTAIPPDTYGDVGTDHYFHMVNLSFTIFNKSGNILLGPMSTGDIWNGLPYSSNSGDGIILYDDQADRWFITTLCLPSFSSPPYFVMVAVSQTSDPAGAWYRWEYQFEDIPDYPKFGIWRDAYFMSCNRFQNQNTFNGACTAAFDRSAMLAGDPSPTMVSFTISSNTNITSILPADCDGPFPPAGTPGYFAYLGSDFLGIYEFHTNWTNPGAATFGNLNKLNTGSYNSNIQGIPQKGSSIKLDPISDRLMYRLQVRKFSDHQSMVVNHTVRVGNRAGIRWYEMRRTTGNWSLYQQSTYAPDSNNRWMGSMAMDSAGNIALGFSVSGYDLFPSVRFTGRMKNDPPGQMTIAEQSIIEGGGAQTHPSGFTTRWGDYSSMTVDPSDPSVFWYTQQYYPVSADIDWHTRIASFSFANILDINTTAAFSSICPGQSDQLDVEVSGGIGSYTFSWTSIPEGFTSSLKNPLISPEFPTRYIVIVSSGNQSRTDTTRVDITPPPIVFAGDDTICCRQIAEIRLTGNAENYTSLKWITTGDGTFTDPVSLYTTYIPGPKDRIRSIIDLQLIAYPRTPCPVVSDHKLIRMDTCSGIPSIGPGNNTRYIYPNPGPGMFTLSLPSDAVLFEISDMAGKMILSRDVSAMKSKEIFINLSDKPKGIYPIRIVLKSRIIRDKLVRD